MRRFHPDNKQTSRPVTPAPPHRILGIFVGVAIGLSVLCTMVMLGVLLTLTGCTERVVTDGGSAAIGPAPALTSPNPSVLMDVTGGHRGCSERAPCVIGECVSGSCVECVDGAVGCRGGAIIGRPVFCDDHTDCGPTLCGAGSMADLCSTCDDHDDCRGLVCEEGGCVSKSTCESNDNCLPGSFCDTATSACSSAGCERDGLDSVLERVASLAATTPVRLPPGVSPDKLTLCPNDIDLYLVHVPQSGLAARIKLAADADFVPTFQARRSPEGGLAPVALGANQIINSAQPDLVTWEILLTRGHAVLYPGDVAQLVVRRPDGTPDAAWVRYGLTVEPLLP